MTGADTRRIDLALAEPLASELEAGVPVVLRVAASGGAGGLVELLAGDRLLGSGRLGGDATSAIDVTAPVGLATHNWQLRFPPQQIDGVAYAEATLDMRFATVPQRSSLAVWGMPSPLVSGAGFAVRCGVRSRGEVRLEGAVLTVRDAEGAAVAAGALGAAPFQGTSALYWAEIAIPAPAALGLAAWTVEFPGVAGPPPVAAASHRFSVAVVAAPDHVVTVTVTDGATGAALHNAHVRIGVHRASTDAAGLARLALTKGRYAVVVAREGYVAGRLTEMDIAADIAFSVTLEAHPEDEGDHWTF